MLFTFTLCLLFFMMHPSSASPVTAQAPVDEPFHYNYTTITGFFLQSEADTDDKTFDFVCRAAILALIMEHLLTLFADKAELWAYRPDLRGAVTGS
jgi:hypothetical protein